MPDWVADGITVAEAITILGGLGALVFGIRAIRRIIIVGDALVNLIGALEHEFTPNGGRHIISADDNSATTKDILLDIRQSFKTIASGQDKHEKSAEVRAQRIVTAIQASAAQAAQDVVRG